MGREGGEAGEVYMGECIEGRFEYCRASAKCMIAKKCCPALMVCRELCEGGREGGLEGNEGGGESASFN